MISNSDDLRRDGRQTYRILACLALPAVLAMSVFMATLELQVWLVFDEWMTGLNHVCHWDCSWYRSIAENGYETSPNNPSGYANYGFYPGFPHLSRALMEMLNLWFVPASLLLNFVLLLTFSTIAWLYRDTLSLKDDRAVVIFLLAFALSPWSLYNRIPYSEMSFNFALLMCFVAWRRDQFILAAIGGFMLCTIRVTGAVLPALLLAELLWQKRQNWIGFIFSFDRRLWALAFMGSGFIVVCFYHYVVVGDPLAYFHIQQAAWGQELRNPLTYFGSAVNGNIRAIYGLAVFFPVVALLALGIIRSFIPLQLATLS